MQYIKVLQLHDGKEHEKSYKTTCWYSGKKLIEIENIFNGAILFFLQLTIYHLSVSKYH